MSAALELELATAAARVRQRHLDHLRALGVSNDTIAHSGGDFMSFGVGDCEAADDGLYLPGSGKPHVIMPVTVKGELIDLCAWSTTNPADWRLRRGIGWALGEDALLRFDTWDDSAVLSSTPLAWLRSGCAGGCILDWAAPELRQLAIWPRLIVDHPRLVAMVRTGLRQPQPLPKIELEEVRNAA